MTDMPEKLFAFPSVEGGGFAASTHTLGIVSTEYIRIDKYVELKKELESERDCSLQKDEIMNQLQDDIARLGGHSND